MHHHIQKDASTCATEDHPIQAFHLHNSTEQHRVSPGCIHGWRPQPAGWHQLPAGALQLHGEHRQHESPDGGHRGSQRSGTRSRQPARHQQHHHHHGHGHHLSHSWHQGAERSAQKVPLHRDSGLENKTKTFSIMQLSEHSQVLFWDSSLPLGGPGGRRADRRAV